MRERFLPGISHANKCRKNANSRKSTPTEKKCSLVIIINEL